MVADDGGRVTLAVLGQKMDEMLRRQDNLERCFGELERRVTTMEKEAAGRVEKLSGLRQDVDRLEGRDTFGSLIAGGMAIIAGLIGWFKS